MLLSTVCVEIKCLENILLHAFVMSWLTCVVKEYDIIKCFFFH